MDAASIACFRMAFGAVMACEVGRYFINGWITAYHIEPRFHFTYYGFGWVAPWPGRGMYVHFLVLGLAAVAILVGLWYRAGAAVFAVGFAYVFLLDQACYLNHFYLIVLLSFLLAVVPADSVWSLDARRGRSRGQDVPAWCLWLLRAQVGIPYFYAGVAKLNADWLRGEPLRTWLAARMDLPVLGPYLGREWVVLAFAYGGLVLDLSIVPLLLWKRTRQWAFACGLAFHGLNAALFDIGVFPWLMMAATTIFFPPDWPRRLAGRRGPALASVMAPLPPPRWAAVTLAGLGLYLAAQFLVPLRHFAYPGNVSWTEEGHRFSWHMKLREKEGRARFVVTDLRTGSSWTVEPSAFLTAAQEERFAGDPDMVLQLAHYITAVERARGREVEVRAWVTASLNAREPQPLIDPSVDLAAQPRSLAHAAWILPLRPAGRRP